MQTEEIGMVETEQEAQAMLEQYMTNLNKNLTRKDAIEYANKLNEAKKKGDFKGIREVWNSLGYKRFSQKDYNEVVRPVVSRDYFTVKTILEKANKAKTLKELQKFTLPHPVVPPVYLMWRNGFKALAAAIIDRARKARIAKIGNVITNKIGA